jgi:hypothetical protein
VTWLAAAQRRADDLEAVLSAAPVVGTEYQAVKGYLLLRVSEKLRPAAASAGVSGLKRAWPASEMRCISARLSLNQIDEIFFFSTGLATTCPDVGIGSRSEALYLPWLRRARRRVNEGNPT